MTNGTTSENDTYELSGNDLKIKRLMMKKQSRFYKKLRGLEQKRQEQVLLKR